MECNQGHEICQIKGEFTVDVKDPGFNCSSTLTTIQIENHSYTVDPVLTLTNPNITPSLQSEIEAALDQFGYLGEVTISSEYESESLITFTILISNTNAPDILLKDNNCNLCEFEAGDCCEIAIPLDGEGAGNPNFALNPDLFYEKLTFDHLNISRIEYGSDCTQGYMRNDFLYDASHRVKDLISTVFEDNTPVLHRYDEHFSYDLAGNFDFLTRNGLISTDANGVGTYGLIDDLAYTYFPGAPNSILQNVTDDTQQPKGFKPVSSTYDYDNNGNIINDDGKGLTIAYNVLNLPQLVTGTTGTIKFDHTFSGEQIKKTVDIGGSIETRLYIGGVEFVDGVPETYYHPDGRIFFKEGVPKFQYKITDHLGNTAVLFEDIDGAGLITMEDPITGISPEVHQRQFYYSFGMAMEGGWKPQSDPEHQYLYNGKELHEDLGLGWYNYGARWYDAAVGRWGQVDPLADLAPNWTPYRYGFDNPILFIDPYGLFEDKKSAKAYAKSRGYKTGWFSRNRIVRQKDGSYNIENKSAGTTQSYDLESGAVLTSALVTAPTFGSTFTDWNSKHGNDYSSQVEAYRAWQSYPGYHEGEDWWDHFFRTMASNSMEARRDYASGAYSSAGGFGRVPRAANGVSNLAIRTDIVLSGGRSGQLVKTLTGPVNSVVKGGQGRIFITDEAGKVIWDITKDRAKSVIPSQGFGPKVAPTQEQLNLLNQIWGN